MTTDAWTADRMRSVFESVKNWGRWGPDDEAGALNLITPAKRLEAAATVATGDVVSCSLPLAVQPAPDNPHPALHMMVRGGDDCLLPGTGFEMTSDFVGVAFHGMATSHIDALCHVFVDGRMYNGFAGTEVRSTGARRGSIMNASDGIVSRGVLLDIPRSMGVESLEKTHLVTVDELDRCVADQNVTIGAGDILLVATGRDATRAAEGAWVPWHGLAGLHPECIPWLHDRDIAVLGADGVSDGLPGLGLEGWFMPVHQCALVAMGVHLLDNLRLDRLSAACAAAERWEFQFTVAPLHVDGGTGSPVNAVAVL